jgi:hypothetical protein
MVVPNVLLREVLPPFALRLGEIIGFIRKEDLEVLFRHLQKVAMDLFERLMISNHFPQHSSITAKVFGEPSEGISIHNILLEILVSVLRRELVPCVQPRD